MKITNVEAVLEFLLYLEEKNPLVFSRLCSGARYTRVMCVFLMGRFVTTAFVNDMMWYFLQTMKYF